MVHTRNSTDVVKATPPSADKQIGKVKKNVKIQVDESSDESGPDTAPFSSKRKLRYNKGTHEASHKSKQNEITRSRSLRSSKSISVEDAQPLQEKKSVSKSKSVEKPRERRRQILVEEEEDLEPSIRRSARQRRGVYDTLNINMLTDHRYVHSFDAFHLHEVKKRKKMQKRRDLEDEDFFEEDNGYINMYDNVKRRHETPTPEKKPRGEDAEDDDGDDEDDEDHDGNESDDDEDEEEEDQQCQENKYLLRKRKPMVNRYMAPPMRKTGEKKDYLSMRKKMLRNLPPHESPVRRFQHKRKAINMSSSTSSDDSTIENEEKRFERRKSKSTAKARLRALPVNLTIEDISKGILKDRDKIGSSLADVDPMSIDQKVQFDSVGGLEKQIKGLKEMILFPLMYPEVFSKFKINPPRGVLFYGPPGTGKTLVARALANECSLGNQKVAFFMRKGADCLSKWVGESERQLRLLFDQAYSMRPSIIFFDEIDGLAPVRSSRQDQIHSSIVSTLLALMDGLDSRGEVVVIGATNRIDAIDPALRRPGRFDREFQFPLPNKQARRHILSIHTKEWEPKPSQAFINELADYCVGYCGADIKALCTEAALSALRRRYPQVYTSNKKLLLDVNSIEVTYKDFFKATKSIVPAFQRSIASPARALAENVKPLLHSVLDHVLDLLTDIFPKANTRTKLENQSSQTSAVGTRTTFHDGDDFSSDDDDDNFPSIYDNSSITFNSSLSRSERYMRRVRQQTNSISERSVEPSHRVFDFREQFSKDPVTYRPRLLLSGMEGAGQTTHLAPAVLHCVEHLTVFSLDLPALYGVTTRTPEEACAQLFREARRSSPSIIYMPHINSLWDATTESLHATLLSLLQDLPPLCPVLLLCTAERQFSLLPNEVQKLFSTQMNQVMHVGLPNSKERRAFFEKLFLEFTLQTTKVSRSKKNKSLEVLPLAPAPPPRQLTETEIKKVQLVEENTLRELRIFLRDIHHKLIVDRRFKEFAKPVDLEEVPDYLEVVEEPMDLSTMMQKIDCHKYNTCEEYLLDIDLITSNALKYNPDIDPLDKIIRHRACELRDSAHSIINSQLEPEFEKTCKEIIEARKQRGETSVCLPAYVHTLPKQYNKKTQDTTAVAPEPTSSTPSQQEVMALSAPDSGSQPSAEVQVKRRRRKRAYWLGPRRRSHKKKNLNRDMEENNEGDTKEDDTEKCDDQENNQEKEKYDSQEKDLDETIMTNENADENVEDINHSDNSSGDEDMDKNDEDPNVGKDVVQNGEENRDDSMTDHCDDDDNPSNSAASPHTVSKTNVCLQNGDINDESSNSSSAAKDKNDCDEVKKDTSVRPATALGDLMQEHTSLITNDYKTDEEACQQLEEKKDEETSSSKNVKHLLNNLKATVALTSLSLKSLESFKDRTPSIEDHQEIHSDTNEATHSEETVNKWKEELQALLDQMVDTTKGCNVETLERYHNRLQLCVHQHRYSADKSELIKEFSILMNSNFALIG